MNERIEELWNKASFDTDSWEAQTRFIEKFAELIVKESVQMFAENGYDESCDMLIEHWDIDPRTFRS